MEKVKNNKRYNWNNPDSIADYVLFYPKDDIKEEKDSSKDSALERYFEFIDLREYIKNKMAKELV